MEEASCAPSDRLQPFDPAAASLLDSAPLGGLDAFRPARKQLGADIGVANADIAVTGLDAHARLQRVAEESSAIRHVCAASRRMDERADASVALASLSAALRRALRDPHLECQMSGDERRAVERIEGGAVLASLCGFVEVLLRYDVGVAGGATADRAAAPANGSASGGSAVAAGAERLHASMLIRPPARSASDVALLRSVGQTVEASADARSNPRRALCSTARTLPQCRCSCSPLHALTSWLMP